LQPRRAQPFEALTLRHSKSQSVLVSLAGYFECSNQVVVGKPRSLSELQAQVQQCDRVKAVGVGHSWWQQQFCSGTDSNSVNIVLTQLNNTLTE